MIAHELEEKPLDLLLAALQERGLLAAGGKQRTDSTHVISAVRDVNRVELAGECVRAAVEALAVAAPGYALVEAVYAPFPPDWLRHLALRPRHPLAAKGSELAWNGYKVHISETCHPTADAADAQTAKPPSLRAAPTTAPARRRRT